jgi:protease-4
MNNSNNKGCLIPMAWVLGALFFFLGSCSVMVNSLTALGEEDLLGEDGIAVLRVEDGIMSPEPWLEQLKYFSEHDHVKGLLIRVDCPGGAVGASQELYQEIKKVADSIPVAVSFANVAASGGYYLSLGATKIFTLPGTMTGSIGVIASYPQYDSLMSMLGVKMNTVKSGRLKDMGSPYRDPTAYERQVFQGMIDDTYMQFFEAVVLNRPIDSLELTKWADGRVITGRQAVKVGLADTLGGFAEAADWLKSEVGLEKDAPLIEWVDEDAAFENMMQRIIQGASLNKFFGSQASSGVYYKI